ncbi:MAG: hypothetical protein Q3962_06090 [Corynebacterium sp.]|nr:hypothetical protein [Corynebacterium sp.]
MPYRASYADVGDPLAPTDYATANPSTPTISQSMADTLGYAPVLRTNFSKSDNFTDAKTISNYYRYTRATAFNANDASWSPDQVSIHDGVLDIKAVRQCKDADGTVTESIEPCPTGSTTQYVSDRVILQNLPAGNFNLSFRMFVNPSYTEEAYQLGIRAFVGLQSMDDTCNEQITPVDYFTQYGSYEASSGTVNCGQTSLNAEFAEHQNDELLEGWHIYTIESWNGHVNLLRDGEVYRSFDGISQTVNWQLFFELLVSGNGQGYMGDMPADEDFYPSHLYVDYIQLAQEKPQDEGALDPPAVPEVPVVGQEMTDYLRYDPKLEVDNRVTNYFNDPTWKDKLLSNGEANRLADASDVWYYSTGTHYKGDNSAWTKDAFSIHDGVLDLKLERHCLDSESDAMTSANASVQPCTEGKITRYSAPRLYSPQIEHGNYVLTIRAKVTGDGDLMDGVRSNLWLQNDQQMCDNSYPDSEYSEFDLLEQYSSRQNTQYATTHVGCEFNKDQNDYYPTRHQDQRQVPEGFYDLWHTWSFQIFNNHIAYYLDGKLIGNHLVTKRDFINQKADYDKAIDHPTRLILENMVETMEWAGKVDNNVDFPNQHFLIDYVQLAREVDPQPVPIDPTTVMPLPTDSPLPIPSVTAAPTVPQGTATNTATETAENTETETETVTENSTVTNHATETKNAEITQTDQETVDKTGTNTVTTTRPRVTETVTVTAEPASAPKQPWWEIMLLVIAGLLGGKLLSLVVK